MQMSQAGPTLQTRRQILPWRCIHIEKFKLWFLKIQQLENRPTSQNCSYVSQNRPRNKLQQLNMLIQYPKIKLKDIAYIHLSMPKLLMQ